MQSKVEVYQNENQIVRDAIDKIIVQVYRKKREQGHQSFLLTGCSAGCGTTHTAINMAVALAMAGWRTVMVDCDIRKGMKYKRLNEDVNVGLSDYLIGMADTPIFATNYEKLDYIPCGNNVDSPVRLLCTKEMEDLAQVLSEDYDFVIYDFPSIESVPDAGIMMSVVDDVILVAGMNETNQQQLDSAKSKVKTYPGKYMGVILNKLDISEYRHYVKNYDYFEKQLFRKKKGTVISNKKEAAETNDSVTDEVTEQTENTETKNGKKKKKK